MILVDTCILLDVVQDDPCWADWSLSRLQEAAARGGVAINPIIYAEFSVWYDDVDRLERTLVGFEAVLQELPREALFLAGKAFWLYRQRGGTRNGVLPDFLIGGHAAVADMPVLTRDTSRIHSYFPTVELLAPSPF